MLLSRIAFLCASHYSQVIGGGGLRGVEDGPRGVGRVSARLRRPPDAQRVAIPSVTVLVLVVDLLVVAHLVLNLLPLLLRHPAEFDGCKGERGENALGFSNFF